MGATEHNFAPNVLNENIEYISGIGLWDVTTGALLKCISEPCQEGSEQPYGDLGVVIKDDLSSVAAFSEVVLGITNFSGESSGFILTINPPDAPYIWSIGAVAFDEWNNRYVVIFQEGRIDVSRDMDAFHYRVLAEGEQGDRTPIDDAQIDPTGQWLVIARGDKTRVLNLNSGNTLLQFDVSRPVLSFDQTGKLLFVGSGNKIAIYSIESAEKIVEYDTSGITSLSISEDNRLVIWGDKEGKIHVWAKSLPSR